MIIFDEILFLSSNAQDFIEDPRAISPKPPTDNIPEQ